MVALVLVVVLSIAPVLAQDTSSGTGDSDLSRQQQSLGDVYVALTESPRDTLTSFSHLRDQLEQSYEAYRAEKTTAVFARIDLILLQLQSLIDLSDVAQANRDTATIETIGYLLDIFARVPLPDPGDVPDSETLEKEGLTYYSIPDTPLRIVQIEDGSSAGEFLFSHRTITVAPRFFHTIEYHSILAGVKFGSWHWLIPQATGPLIPSFITDAIPYRLKSLWLGTPIWKVIVIVLIVIPLVLVLGLLHKLITRRKVQGRMIGLSLRVVQPITLLGVFGLYHSFVKFQLVVTGDVLRIINGVDTLAVFGAMAWLFWLLTKLFFEWLILSPRISDESLDANLLRLVAGIIGVIGVIVILAIGGQALGVPILSMLAGLGIGGVAVALAIRPTLENLIGGFVLYFDKPIRVGDFCTFGDHTGTVESIGVRSVEIRALDRTLISVPNAQFADLQITNWARCDQMMIQHVIGLRYETDDDQLRYVLAKMREMFHGHPRIDSDTVRVRLVGYGASSKDVEFRVYAKTREWNDFYAIQEDVLFRISEIVTQAGTGFAFPSQTVYVTKDEGLDSDLEEKAREEVATWRRTGQFPFPRFAATKLERIEGSLDYPPRGSPDHARAQAELEEGGERLSTEPPSEEAGDAKGTTSSS